MVRALIVGFNLLLQLEERTGLEWLNFINSNSICLVFVTSIDLKNREESFAMRWVF